MNRKNYFFILLLLLSVIVSCTNADHSIHVSIAGEDTNSGTVNEPVRTIKKAVALLRETHKTQIIVHEGVYKETIDLSNISGTQKQPVVIKAADNENVLLDGTLDLKDLIEDGEEWELYKDNIYKIKLKQDIWQFFYDGEEMMPARWPNARFDDESVWDQEHTWCKQGNNSSYGKIYSTADNPQLDLAKINKDYTGAMLVLNLGRFMTFSRKVINHNIREGYLTYTPDYMKKTLDLLSSPHYWTPVYKNPGKFYIECHINALDVTKEWYYDKNTHELFFISPDKKMPTFNAKGKVMEYAFNGIGVRHLVLDGLNFFGTTFAFADARYVKIQNCNLHYYSTNKRMLGVEDTWNRMYSTQSTYISVANILPHKFAPYSDLSDILNIMKNKNEFSKNVIRNCQFSHTDGAAFGIDGIGDTLDNLAVHYIDWSGVGFITIHAGWAFNNHIKRVSISHTGASEGIQHGFQSLLELCDFGEKMGVMQEDGGALQVSAGQQKGSTVRYNWVHDNFKFGLRADFNGSPNEKYPNGYGSHLKMHHNVGWNMSSKQESPALHLEGDYHFVFNNTLFHNPFVRGICIAQTWAEGLANYNTQTKNNLTEINGIGTSRTRDIIEEDILGDDSNNIQRPIEELLVDVDNFDFRPRKDAVEIIDKGVISKDINAKYVGEGPDIGAYEYGDDCYWIPGFQYPYASFPIPANNSIIDYLDRDLIWQQAYGAIEYMVYFGESKEVVANATEKSQAFIGKFHNNICPSPVLKTNTRYYWRIDAVYKNKPIVKGKVWNFKTN